MASLSDEDVLKIYNWYEEGMTVRDIARHFDVVESHIYNIVNGRVRKDLHRIYYPNKYKEEKHV